jgi:hypothetical protein
LAPLTCQQRLLQPFVDFQTCDSRSLKNQVPALMVSDLYLRRLLEFGEVQWVSLARALFRMKNYALQLRTQLQPEILWWTQLTKSWVAHGIANLNRLGTPVTEYQLDGYTKLASELKRNVSVITARE